MRNHYFYIYADKDGFCRTPDGQRTSLIEKAKQFSKLPHKIDGWSIVKVAFTLERL